MEQQGIIINPFREKIIGETQVVRSYTFNMSNQFYGGNQYESQSFFCSQKAGCSLVDARDVSDALYHFCKSEVLKAMRVAIMDLKEGRKNYGA